jgi:hypothetical protein
LKEGCEFGIAQLKPDSHPEVSHYLCKGIENWGTQVPLWDKGQ